MRDSERPNVAARWIRAHDPRLLAVKRSVRAAVVMPLAFGTAHILFSNPQVGLFAAFGSFSLLLLVEFPGRARVRLVSYAGLWVVGVGFIIIGTLFSTDKVASVVAMAVVGFVVLFAGIVTPQAATASTAALLLFVLPVAVTVPRSDLGPRLLGWVVAGAFCIPACMLIWPTPWHDSLRQRLSAAVAAVGVLAGAHAEGRADPGARDAVDEELALLREQFRGTPYPPTGAAGGAVALAKLVGRVEWVAGNPLLSGDTIPEEASGLHPVVARVADTLQLSAGLLADGGAAPADDHHRVTSLQESTRQLDQLLTSTLDAEVSELIHPDPPVGATAVAGPVAQPGDAGAAGGVASALDPSFRVRSLGVATEMVADAALESVGAQATGDRRLGALGEPPARQIGRRIVSHLSGRSVWFRNAVRGAAGLALAVGVIEVTDVEHGFWVVLGTLSVLRTNAVGTGATALRAIGGTAVGFIVGSLVMIGVAGHAPVLWLLLPPAILISGVAPVMISFAAGQAGFTLVVIILFNIIAPVGWKVGLTRIEDVAIGCGVSIVVGFLFWPRGATAALGRALSDAFVTSSGYLSDAVDRLTVTDRVVDTGPGQRASHRAYLRLDDAFRQFLAERGTKVVPVETVARLFTGSNRIRLAAFTLASLATVPPGPGRPEMESVAVAGAVLRDSFAASHRWYEEFAEVLADHRTTLDPPPAHGTTVRDVLQEAFDDARAQGRGDRLRKVLQMLWADELLENQCQVQADLAGSAALFSHRRRQGRLV